MVQIVADEYGVDARDVSMDVDYDVSGSFTVENADPSQSDVVEDTIRQSISKQTGIPVTDIDVNYNSDTGEVEYTISSNSYDDSNAIKGNIENDSFTDTIEADLQSSDEDLDLSSAEINDEILANINIIIDVKDSNADLSVATANLASELSADGFTLDKRDVITDASSLNLSKEVTDQYPEAEAHKLVQSVAEEYGVNTDDVLTDIDYEVSGSFTVENVDPAQVRKVQDAIVNSISEQTGAPVSDIEVNYNSDTAVVEYTVKTDFYNDSNDIKENIDKDAFTDAIQIRLQNIDSNIDVSSPQVNETIAADINIIVDTQDAAIDKNKATKTLEVEFSSDGFTVEADEGMFHKERFFV